MSVKCVLLSLTRRKLSLCIYETQNQGKSFAVMSWNVPDVEYYQNYLWLKRNIIWLDAAKKLKKK